MGQVSGLDGLLAFWNSLTHKQREELARNMSEFHALVGSLKNRGIIECDKSVSEIVVIKRSREVRILKFLLKKINAQGIKIIDKSSEITP